MDSNFQAIVKQNLNKLEEGMKSNQNFMMLVPLANLYKSALLKQLNTDEKSIYLKLLDIKREVDTMIDVYEIEKGIRKPFHIMSRTESK